MLRAVLPDSARRFARAMVISNLDPPVRTTDDAIAYRERILAAGGAVGFTPLMTLYLTEQTTPEELARARASGVVFAVGEAFLTGATTHSSYGVRDFLHCTPALAAMEDLGLPLLLHGEVTDPGTDILDREAAFIERQARPIVERFPRLKVMLEHITTREAVAFVTGCGPAVAATITAHHLLLNRNAMFAGGLRPHAYCLLPAGAQGGGTSPGAAGGSDRWQSQVLSRDRQLTSFTTGQGISLWLCGHLHRTRRDRTVRRGF